MSKIADIIKYICKMYPYDQELSKARLTKMVYLADWESARRFGRQITEINWYFNNYGPYVDDVFETALMDPEIDVITTTTIYGTPKIQIRYLGNGEGIGLSKEEIIILNQVISQTQLMYWNGFISYVYDTYPIRENAQYSYLNLVELASQEKADNKKDRNFT